MHISLLTVSCGIETNYAAAGKKLEYHAIHCHITNYQQGGGGGQGLVVGVTLAGFCSSDRQRGWFSPRLVIIHAWWEHGESEQDEEHEEKTAHIPRRKPQARD